MRKCKIGIIGFGTVGKGIYRILNSKNNVHPILKEIEIVGIAVKNINKKRDIELENNLLINKLFGFEWETNSLIENLNNKNNLKNLIPELVEKKDPPIIIKIKKIWFKSNSL